METEKEKVVIVAKKPAEPIVANPFSSEFVKNFDSKKEIEKQSEVYKRPAKILEEKQVVEEKKQVVEEKKQEEKPVQETIFSEPQKAVIETPNYDFIEVQDTGLKFDNKMKQKRKFRLKLASIVYCFIFALCSGWVIGNAIELSKTSYTISEIQYLIKIEQLDGFQEVQNGDSIITTIVDVEPQPLAEPTNIQPQTNWFDRFCDWLGNIFGG